MTEYVMEASSWSALGLVFGYVIGKAHCYWKDHRGPH